jgi:MYXO-CTERM domain-containing protein
MPTALLVPIAFALVGAVAVLRRRRRRQVIDLDDRLQQYRSPAQK